MTTATTAAQEQPWRGGTTAHRLAWLAEQQAATTATLAALEVELDDLQRQARESETPALTAAVSRVLARKNATADRLTRIENDAAHLEAVRRGEVERVQRNQAAQTIADHRAQQRLMQESLKTLSDALFYAYHCITEAQKQMRHTTTTGSKARDAAHRTAILDGLDPQDTGLEMLEGITGVLARHGMTYEDTRSPDLPTIPVLTWPLDARMSLDDLRADLRRWNDGTH